MDLNTLITKAEKKLVNVHPEVAAKAIELVKKCHAQGINILITQGMRTVAEQNALYAQGRTKPGAIVTNARGGYSIHNFGLAFDFAVYGKDGKTIEWSTSIDTNSDGYKDYLQVGAIGKTLNLKWGGDFRSIVDYPHFEHTFGLSLAALRAGKRPAVSATIAAARSYLQKGDSGTAVTQLQALLRSAGYNIAADGDYGAATELAVKSFQKANGLVEDGIAGVTTMAKLKSGATKKEEAKVVEEYKKDAAPSSRFAEAQKWVIEKGISDGTYPQRPVTREEVWAMLYRMSEGK